MLSEQVSSLSVIETSNTSADLVPEGRQCSLSDEVSGESNSGDERVVSGPGSDRTGSGPVKDERVG